MPTPRKAAKKRAPRATAPRPTDVERAALQRPFAALGEKLRKSRVEPAAAPRAEATGEVVPDPRPSQQDERLRFAQLMRGVKPLRDGARRVPTSLDALESPRGGEDDEDSARDTAKDGELDRSARAKLEAFVAEGIRFEVADDGESLEGRRLDVDPREIRKLRQLRYALDGTLDLHGLTAVEARAKLESFLRRRRLQGDRAVLVIHGKGKHSARGYAVLRGEIAAWLSQGRAQRDVAAFASVHERDGGTGALCVLLAR
jgi:DNA-nicking Smr family endonuclease